MNPVSSERCFNHRNREAAARCPECRRFFCRECVTEHDDKVICATCLKGLTADGRSTQQRLRAVSWFFQFLAGLALVWGLFYGAGQFLLLIPSSFHEGNVWKIGTWGP